MTKTSSLLLVLVLLAQPAALFGAPETAPDRERGEGPFDRLILRGVILVNGEGAPADGRGHLGQPHRFDP